MTRQAKPTKAALAAAANRGIEDVIAPGLRVLFVGINPGLYSGWSGHHFARPGNRFWPTLHAAGFTPRLLHPSEERELLAYGCGITNFVNRATATAAELAPDELVAGGERLLRYGGVRFPTREPFTEVSRERSRLRNDDRGRRDVEAALNRSFGERRRALILRRGTGR